MIVASLQHYIDALPFVLLALLLDGLIRREPRGPRPQLNVIPVLLAKILVQLAVFVVTSLISRALAPKPKPPEPGKAETPDIKEGRAPVEIFGAVWRKESFLAGWKQLDPPEPIKLKQGKK